MLDNQIPGELLVISSITELEKIISNLLFNAVSYSIDRSEIRVDMISLDNRICLLITNTVEHLDESDLAVMFDRFWRKSEARTSPHHTGLGLALVKAYADLLELKISTELSDKRRFTVSICNMATVYSPS